MKPKKIFWIIPIVMMTVMIWQNLQPPVEQPFSFPAARAASSVTFTGNKIVNFRTGTNWYIRLVDAESLKIASAAGVLASNTAWGSSDMAMSDETTLIGCWTATVPSALPAGIYYVLYYDSASPAYTDPLQFGKYMVWDGSKITEMGDL